jgi:hypothetical protein
MGLANGVFPSTRRRRPSRWASKGRRLRLQGFVHLHPDLPLWRSGDPSALAQVEPTTTGARIPRLCAVACGDASTRGHLADLQVVLNKPGARLSGDAIHPGRLRPSPHPSRGSRKGPSEGGGGRAEEGSPGERGAEGEEAPCGGPPAATGTSSRRSGAAHHLPPGAVRRRRSPALRPGPGRRSASFCGQTEKRVYNAPRSGRPSRSSRRAPPQAATWSKNE